MRRTHQPALQLLWTILVVTTGARAQMHGGDATDPPAADPASAAASEAEVPPAGLAAGDWTGIRAAYESSRHAVAAVEGGHRARNRGQQWTTAFDGRGFTTHPDAGGWSWGLELLRYGWPFDEREVERPATVVAEGARVAYDWDERLTEWWINERRGLEHGFTVASRPPSAAGPLTLALSVRGALVPAVSASGRDVRFDDAAGAPILCYAGLTVTDADGRALAAAWEARPADERGPHELHLRVDDRDARYPLTIDPIAQQAYLKQASTNSNDRFGFTVAIDGDTAVVGVPWEDSAATGVDGDWTDNTMSAAGAAYVFHREGVTWSKQAYLKASNTGFDDHLGWSVSIFGDTAVVGAEGESSAATGVGGDEADDSAFFAGAAYVFERTGTSWAQQAYLKASNTETEDHFGYSVDVHLDTVVVGTYYEDSAAAGVGGDGSDNSAVQSGALYVYERSGVPPVWSFSAYVKASNPQANDYLGRSVSISGDTLVSGANSEDSSATGIDGDQLNNDTTDAGAVYVFERIPAAPYWEQQAYIKASNSGLNDEFGNTVDIDGDRLVVGAHWEDSNATGVDGDQANDLAPRAGAAYVFERTGGAWSQLAYLKASNTDSIDEFGWAVAIHADTIVVGAFREDSVATGVNGDDDNDSAMGAGAAYVFDLETEYWTDTGNALAGIFGDPVLLGYGPMTLGSSNLIELGNAAPSAYAGLFIALSSTPVPFAGGTLRPNPFLLVTFTTDPSGTISLPFTMTASLPAGTELWFQFAIVDAAAIFGKSLSNAIMTVMP